MSYVSWRTWRVGISAGANSGGRCTAKRWRLSVFWSWTKAASKVYRAKSTFWGQLEVPLLDINPEGTLEREIKDTIEELDIMLHVAKCHRTVLKQYVPNADHMLDPYGEFGHAHRKIPSSLTLYNKTRHQQKGQPELDGKEKANK